MRRINDRYEFDPRTDELGKGGFGRVFKARDTLLERDVVLKFAEKGNLPEKYSLVQEISRVIDYSHPNLVRYYDAIVMNDVNNFGEEIQYQIGVMEYVRDGDLRKFMDTKPSPEQVQQIITGILKGLDYLHERNIIHRDIKPPNVLLNVDSGLVTPKICDFGISKVAGSESTTLSNVIGTFEYMSPEQLGSNPDQRIKTNSDLWSLGIMIYEMFVGDLPFGSRRSGTTDAKIVGNILSAPIPDQIEKVPPPYRKMVEICLVREARDRAASARDLLNLLETPATSMSPRTSATEVESMISPLLSDRRPEPIMPVIPKEEVPEEPIKEIESPLPKAQDTPKRFERKTPEKQPPSDNSVTSQISQKKRPHWLPVIWFLLIIPVTILFGFLFEDWGFDLWDRRGTLTGFWFGSLIMGIAGLLLVRKYPPKEPGGAPTLYGLGLGFALDVVIMVLGMSFVRETSGNQYSDIPLISPGIITLGFISYLFVRQYEWMSKGGIILAGLFGAFAAGLQAIGIGEWTDGEATAFICGFAIVMILVKMGIVLFSQKPPRWTQIGFLIFMGLFILISQAQYTDLW